MKKKRGPIILLILFAVLLVIYFLLSSWNTKKENEEEAAAEASIIYIVDMDSDDIEEITYDTGSGEMSFTKNDDTWYYAEDTDFPLDQTYPEEMALELAALSAERELEDADDPEDYGLDDPQYYVQLADGDGNTIKIVFGNETGDNYYAMITDGETVYTVATSALDVLGSAIEDMAELDEFPSIGSGNLVSETITQDGVTTVYDSEDEDQDEDIAAIAGGLGAVDLEDAADYSVEDEDLASYGLDEDSRTTAEVVYTDDDEEETLMLYFGDEAEDEDEEGYRYVMMNDSRIVYLISTEVCDNILNVE